MRIIRNTPIPLAITAISGAIRNNNVKFYINPLALRARSARINLITRIVTVCYSTTRASEASGFSTVQCLLRMAAHLCACYRMLRLLAFGADLCYIINVEEFSSHCPSNFISILMSSIIVHFKESALDHLADIGATYQFNNNELDVIVDDVPYEFVDGTYQDPDEQLCEFYGFNYDLVNCIEKQ